MPESLILGKGLGCMGCKLWSLVRPYDVYPVTTEDTKKNAGEASGHCVLTHVDDLWPVGTAVNNNEKLVSTVGAEISSYFLE